MKYELIKKILNSPITILDYLILEHIANNTAKEFIDDEKIFNHVSFLKTQEYISDNNKFNIMKKASNEEQSNNANVLLSAVWVEWMTTYPKKNGLYLITPRGKTETWVGYWNDAMRRFEEAVPEFTDKGIDVDWWAEMPVNPNCR